MCVWFPNWPLQRIQSTQPEHKAKTLVLYADAKRRGWQVVACCSSASAWGVVPGMSVAEAKGLLGTARRSEPEPLFVAHDPEADLAALRKLAIWCQRFTPVVGLEGTDNLLLDLTGCTHLFGGEHRFARRLHRHLVRWDLFFRTAIADTVGAAWAVAHFREENSSIVLPHRQVVALQSLPVASLRLPDSATTALMEFDIRTIEQLQALPRASLPSRFGPEVTRRLDQALGTMEERIAPERPPEPVRVSQNFEDSISDRRTLEFVLDRLIEQLVEKLSKIQRGVQQLEVILFDGSQQAVTFVVGTLRPTQSVEHLRELVRTRWEQIVSPRNVTGIQLEAAAVSTLGTHQDRLFDTGENPGGEREFAKLVDRLSSRLGKQRVVRPRYVPDAQPERSVRWEPVLETETASLSPLVKTLRPLRLLNPPLAVEVTSVVPDGPPIRCFWENRSHTVARCWGPERIETGWWRERHIRRDYYRIETESGQRFWLFRNLELGDWFLHGEFE